jgi:hypothetical protein
VDGVYLDCCTSLPSECQQPGACNVTSAVEYAAQVNSLSSAAATHEFAAFPFVFMTFVVALMK